MAPDRVIAAALDEIQILSMAQQRNESIEGVAPPATDVAESVTPVPTATLRVTITVLAKGDVLHPVHQEKYQPDHFNPGVHGNARFSPIQDDQGRALPILYGGTTVECALMETVFHDVPHTAGFKSFDKGKLVDPSSVPCVNWVSLASN